MIYLKITVHKLNGTLQSSDPCDQLHVTETRRIYSPQSFGFLGSLKFRQTFDPRLFWLCVSPVKEPEHSGISPGRLPTVWYAEPR